MASRWIFVLALVVAAAQLGGCSDAMSVALPDIA
jgi:hypothetical protein